MPEHTISGPGLGPVPVPASDSISAPAPAPSLTSAITTAQPRLAKTQTTEKEEDDDDDDDAAAEAIRIEPGYRPGFLARILQMHMDYYHPIKSWGRAFEAELAQTFGNIVARLPDVPDSQIWSAVRASDGEIVGTVILDAADVGDTSSATGGAARLRGFIVGDGARGFGVGRRLLGVAMAHVRERGIGEVVLHTMASLEAALHLYRDFGFRVVYDRESEIWGAMTREQQHIWRAGGQG